MESSNVAMESSNVAMAPSNAATSHRNTAKELSKDHNKLRVYSLDASLLAHAQGGEVGVSAGTVPVSGHGFGVEGDDDTEVLSHTVQDEAGDPQVVSHADPLTGSNLELPLRTRRR